MRTKALTPTALDWMLVRILLSLANADVETMRSDHDTVRVVQYLRERFGQNALDEMIESVRLDREIEKNIVGLF